MVLNYSLHSPIWCSDKGVGRWCDGGGAEVSQFNLSRLSQQDVAGLHVPAEGECDRGSDVFIEAYKETKTLGKETKNQWLACGSCCGSEGRPVPAEHRVWWQRSLLPVEVFYELRERSSQKYTGQSHKLCSCGSRAYMTSCLQHQCTNNKLICSRQQGFETFLESGKAHFSASFISLRVFHFLAQIYPRFFSNLIV